MSPAKSSIRVVRREGWAEIRIEREEKRNALDRAARAALAEALRALEVDARVVVVTGSGGSFCAGLDLRERDADRAAGRPADAGREWVELNVAIREHPAVFVAAVNGVAMGAGVTLMNSCDLVLAADDATFGCPELASGTYAGASGPTTQLSSIPRKRVAWMLLTAERLDAATMERWGLVNEVVPAARLAARAGELAARLAGRDPIALAEVKRALDLVPALARGWRDAMELGQEVNATIRRRRQEAFPAAPAATGA